MILAPITVPAASAIRSDNSVIGSTCTEVMNISASKTAGTEHHTISIPGMRLSCTFNLNAFDIATTIAKEPIPRVSAKLATNPIAPDFLKLSFSS